MEFDRTFLLLVNFPGLVGEEKERKGQKGFGDFTVWQMPLSFSSVAFFLDFLLLPVYIYPLFFSFLSFHFISLFWGLLDQISSRPSESCPMSQCTHKCHLVELRCNSLCYHAQPTLLEKSIKRKMLNTNICISPPFHTTTTALLQAPLFCLYHSPTFSAFSVSQMLQLKLSYPANKRRPDMESASDVTALFIWPSSYVSTSWSERMSNILRVQSSEPVTKAFPLFKN